jgi:hypothetical protein
MPASGLARLDIALRSTGSLAARITNDERLVRFLVISSTARKEYKSPIAKRQGVSNDDEA